MGLSIEYDDMRSAIRLATVSASLTIFFSLLILALSLWIYRTPTARHHIERLSWKLFMVIMGIQVVWASVYIVTYGDADLAHAIGNSDMACAGVMWLMTGTRLTVSWLLASIAVNLALTVQWEINTSREGLTKWYIIGSCLMGYIPPFISAARGHFAGGVRYDVCYFNPVRPYRQYLLNVFFAFHLWLALATLIALIAVIISLSSIFVQGRRTSRLMRRSARNSLAALQPFPPASNSSDQAKPTRWSPWIGLRGNQRQNVRPIMTPLGPRCRLSMYALDDAFLSIALRVAVYPVMAVIINTVYISSDVFFYLYSGDLDDSYLSLFKFYFMLYTGRGAIFAIVAMLIDPCFHQGLKAAWKARKAPASPMDPIQQNTQGTLANPFNSPNADPGACSFREMMMPSNPTFSGLAPISPLVQIKTPKTSIIGLIEGDVIEKGRTAGMGEDDVMENASQASKEIQGVVDGEQMDEGRGLRIQIGCVQREMSDAMAGTQDKGARIEYDQAILADIEGQGGVAVQKESDISRL